MVFRFNDIFSSSPSTTGPQKNPPSGGYKIQIKQHRKRRKKENHVKSLFIRPEKWEKACS